MSKDNERFETGLAIRKEVLGADYVERSMRAADEFNQPLQELITEFAWGAVWSRPGLTRQTRSIINLAMITALNRPHELALHIRGALNNGVTREEIREVLLQTTVYCGAPAALDAFRVARAVFAEVDNPADARDTPERS